MGRLDVHITHGGGGPELPGVVPLAVIAAACIATGAVLLEALMIVVVIICAVGAAVTALWFATRRSRAERRAEVAAQWAANRQAIEAEAEQRQIRRAIASAPQVTISLDASLLAGLMNIAQQQPAKVIRAGIEPLDDTGRAAGEVPPR